MSVDLGTILDFLKERRVLGKVDRKLNRVRALMDAEAGDLTFCVHSGEKGTSMIQRSKGTVIICGVSLYGSLEPNLEKTIVFVENPRLAFMRVVSGFFAPPSTSSGIARSARIGRDCSIASDVSIGENVVIGNQVAIGEHSNIQANVRIYDRVRIGKNVTVHAGTVIGDDGFGYERDESGHLEKFPHLGSVVIDDSVEIGANTCIDRGTLGNTMIGFGTKIDNLVHIAHNVSVGAHCVIVAHSMIGGGTSIGDFSWIAPCACIRDGLSIGKRTLIGMGAVVTKDVPDNTIVYGVPAKPVGKRT